MSAVLTRVTVLRECTIGGVTYYPGAVVCLSSGYLVLHCAKGTVCVS